MANGGSPYGWSKLSKWLGCGRRANLDEQRQGQNDLEDTPDALALGVLIHQPLEDYYSGTETVRDLSAYSEDQVAEARRIYGAYAGKYSPTELGHVVAVECTLPAEPPPELLEDEVPSEEWQTQAKEFEERCLVVAKSLGLPGPVTCRSDLVVRLAQSDCDRIYEVRHVETTPGIWIVDHKTAGRRDPNAAMKWQGDHQMVINYLLWSASHPDESCQGVLVNVIYKTKEVGFDTFKCVPGPAEIAATKHAINLSYQIQGNQFLRDIANSTHCFDWYRVCPYLQTGVCQRF